MKISVSLTIDSQAQDKMSLINVISESLTSFFDKRSYGEGLIEILISCKCVQTFKGFEHLHKTQKPKFIEYKLLTNKFTGLPLLLDRVFMYDIKFNENEYENFLHSSDPESSEIYVEKLIDSLDNLERLPKKVKDFQKDKFKSDFIEFLKI